MEPTGTMQDTVISGIAEAVGVNRDGFLSDVVLGNAVLSLLSALIIFVTAILLLMAMKRVALRHLERLAKKTKARFDDAIVGFLQGISSFFYVSVALFAAVQHLVLPDLVQILIKGAFFFAIVYETIRLSEGVLALIVAVRLGKLGEEETGLSSALSLILRVVLWTVGILIILSNLGFNVTSLLASLGIGGLAVSLALQPLFSDIFSSFSIVLDKPFEEGDYIVCGEYKGTVKRIGLKTTRLQALQGEELIISNAELTTARIQNFKRLQKRRITFAFGVTYDTSPEKLREIPGIVESIITKEGKTEFDRAHFWEFGDSSLNFEVVYYINSSEYVDYMDAQQSINLSILEALEEEGVEMAFPTRTIHIVGEKVAA